VGDQNLPRRWQTQPFTAAVLRDVKLIGASVLLGVLVFASTIQGDQVSVRYAEGLVRGFLTLTDLDGNLLANGDLIQNARGPSVTTRLVFRFKDGSLHDETAVYSQQQQFRLLTDHLVQKGPSFPRQLDAMIDVTKGQVTVRVTEDGKERVESARLDLQADLANGLVSTLLKNVRAAEGLPKALPYIALTPKPRLVKLTISSAGEESFSTGTLARKATHYVLKADIGGLAGVIAPLVGKQPPDSHVWILHGDAPAFVKSEQPLYYGGPVWRIELTSPRWRHS
jgi:hypothetical protein